LHHELQEKSIRSQTAALAISALYVLLGVLYIVFSDAAVSAVSPNEALAAQLQSFKGIAFIGCTGFGLYCILSFYFARTNRSMKEKLRASGALLSVLKKYPGPSAIVDEDRNILQLNASLLELTNIPAEATIGKNIGELLPAEDGTTFLSLLDEVFSNGQPKDGEVTLNLGFEFRYYAVTVIPLTGATGAVERALVLSHDVTDRRSSALQHEKQQRELRKIIDLIPDFIFARDTNGRYILANDAFSRFHGMTTEQILGKTAEQVLPDASVADDMRREDREVLKKGETIFNPHQEMVDNEGVHHIYQVTKIPFRTATNNSTAVLGLAVDITQRLESERAINKSEERFRALVNHSLDALFVYNDAGTLTLVNERACTLLGKSREELIGQKFIDILSAMPASDNSVPSIFQPDSAFQIQIRGNQGQEIPVEVRIGILPDNGTISYLAEARDISERLQIERERMGLSRLGIGLSASQTPSEVAHTVFDAIRNYLKLDAFFFAIRISGKSRFRQILLTDTISGEMKYFPGYDYTTRSDSPVKDVYDGKNVLLLRPGNDQRFQPFGDKSRQSQSIIYCPVVAGDKVVALVSVQSYERNFYTQENVDLVQRIADMAGPALESARASRRGSIFAELGRQLGAARTAEDVTEVIGNMADELVGWEACAIALYSPADDNITYIYLADEENGERRRFSDPGAFTRPRYHTERVLKEGAFLVLRDKDATGEMRTLPNQGVRSPLSMIWVPIPGENGPTGFITLHRYNANAYDDDDLESVRALADHCGAALNRTASQELLRYTEERYRLAIESTGAVAYQLDYLTMEYVFMGREIEAITGYPPESFSGGLWKKITLESQMAPNCQVTYDDDGRKHFKHWRTEFRIRRLDGEERWLSDQAVQLHNAAGTPTGTLGIIRDITEQKRVELALRASEERYALSARGANDGLWDWDLISDNIHFSDRYAQMLGYEPDSMFNKPEEWFAHIHPGDVESMKTLLQEHLLGTSKHFECEVRTRHKNNIYLWMLIRGIAVRNAEGVPTRIAGSQTDITDRVLTQERLLHDALHDPLTGLPNRSLLMEQLDRCLEHMRRRTDYHFAVIFMDLDRFKTINDSLGHLVGDHVLVTVSQRLKSCVRPMDTVTRFAGDEFAVVLDQIKDETEIIDIMARIQSVISEPIVVDSHEISTSASAGVAIGSSHYDSPSEILRDADNALYKSKADGAGRFRIFDSSMHEHAVRALRLEADLRRAIERDQLHLAFQPIISLATGRIERFETLVRWNHPEFGLLTPDHFLPTAEETGLVFSVDEWVIRESCRAWKQWRDAIGPSNPEIVDKVRLNVNLSPRHFLRHVNLTERLTDIVTAEDLNPSLLGLELTENALLSFHDETTTALHNLKEAGFTLYLDDFGKGYSSLSYLHNFPFDFVKIDRLFIMRMQENGPEREVVQAIVSLAERLRLGVVAEGVETSGQIDLVRQMGCDQAQGFYISRPVDASAALEMIQQVKTW